MLFIHGGRIQLSVLRYWVQPVHPLRCTRLAGGTEPAVGRMSSSRRHSFLPFVSFKGVAAAGSETAVRARLPLERDLNALRACAPAPPRAHSCAAHPTWFLPVLLPARLHSTLCSRAIFFQLSAGACLLSGHYAAVCLLVVLPASLPFSPLAGGRSIILLLRISPARNFLCCLPTSLSHALGGFVGGYELGS